MPDGYRFKPTGGKPQYTGDNLPTIPGLSVHMRPSSNNASMGLDAGEMVSGTYHEMYGGQTSPWTAMKEILAKVGVTAATLCWTRLGTLSSTTRIKVSIQHPEIQGIYRVQTASVVSMEYTHFPANCGMRIMSHLYVMPSARRLGLGREMLELLEFFYQEGWGHSRIIATTNPYNEHYGMCHLLQRQGWQEGEGFYNNNSGNMIRVWAKDYGQPKPKPTK